MNEKVLRISVVSYLNSKPFIYGLKKANFNIPVELTEDIPSACADKLIRGQAEIGLVPVAALPLIKNYSIISDYCIGSWGNVNSVLMLSDVPMKEIKTVLLDYQSRTSVMLTKVLAKKHWKISPEWQSTERNYESKIKGQTAGVVIGDRALRMKNNFAYVYDLSAEWENFTHLPFVFACWVSTVKLEENFLSEFNNALERGLENINRVAETEHSSSLSTEQIRQYLTESIDFKFDDQKKTAMELFLSLSVGI